MSRNYDYFMKADLSPFRDQWVAVVDEEIVAHGHDVRLVYQEAVRKRPAKRPLLARVPGQLAMIL